jgi:CubicO group peptidase (beta-lactamase class C family)
MNAENLFIWHQALVENKLLKKETLKHAQTPFTLKNGTSTHYGFGWELSDLYGSSVIWHSGSINGYASMEIYLPKEDLFLATFCNVQNKNAIELTRLAACLLTLKPITNEIALPESAFRNYTGVYKFKLDEPSTIRVFKRDGKYYMQDSRSSKAWQMHFTSTTDFFCYEVFPNNHTFTKNSSGKVDGFLIKAPTYESRIKKIE